MKERSVLVSDLSTAAITSAATTIYTVPSNTRAKWRLAFLSNTTGSTIANVTLNIEDGASVTVLGSKSLTAAEFLQFDGNGAYVILEAGDEIRARADATGISCILTLEETTGLVSTS